MTSAMSSSSSPRSEASSISPLSSSSALVDGGDRPFLFFDDLQFLGGFLEVDHLFIQDDGDHLGLGRRRRLATGFEGHLRLDVRAAFRADDRRPHHIVEADATTLAGALHTPFRFCHPRPP